MIIRLIASEYRREQEAIAYRIYVTDTLRVMVENTARFAGGSYVKARFYDMVYGAKKQVNEKSGDEIVAEIVSRAGLELA